MANRWLLKSDPDHYGFDDLLRDKRTVWDGVTNSLALIHLRAMRKGDSVLVYATGDVKAAVGTATVASDPYPDPKQDDPRIVAVDLVPGKRLPRAVTLAEMRADRKLAGLDLLRISRLSVMPVSQAHWKRILDLASGAALKTGRR